MSNKVVEYIGMGKEIININNMSDIKAKTGDIILYHGKTWLSRQILKWMNKYRKKLGLKIRPLFNHVSVVVDLWGELYTVEAVARGVIMQPLNDSFKSAKSIVVKTWVKSLTSAERRLFNKTAVKLAASNVEYDVFNFLWQMIKIKTGKWFGPKGVKSRNKIYCSELAAIVMDKIRSTFKGKTWDKSPLDISLTKELKVSGYYDF